MKFLLEPTSAPVEGVPAPTPRPAQPKEPEKRMNPADIVSKLEELKRMILGV